MSDGQLWWDGSTLPGDEIALVLFARTTSSGARVPVLGAVATGSAGFLLLPHQFAPFLEQHAEATLICHDAADLHWLLHGHFQQSDDQQSLERLWAFSAEARLVDIGILDQYTRRGPGLLAARPRSRRRLIADWVDVELPANDAIEQRVVEAMRGADDEVLALALRVSQGVWQAYEALKTKAARLDAEVTRVAERAQTLRDRPLLHPGGDPDRAKELEEQAREFVSVFNRGVPASEPARVETTAPVSPEASPRAPFGSLGSGIDVQAAIALHRPDRPVLQLDRGQLVEAAAANGRRFEAACRALWQDRRARDCFHWRGPGADGHLVDRDDQGRPRFKGQPLQQWLRGVSDNLVDEHNLAVALPVTGSGEPSFDPEQWGVLASCDPGLAAWRDLVRSCRFMQFRDRADAQQVQYDVCPILRAKAPDLVAIRSLGYRVFRPAEGNIFLVVGLQHLHLRCFARLYAQQRPGSPSRLADHFLQKEDPITAIAAGLYTDMKGDESGSDWEERLDDSRDTQRDDAARCRWVGLTRALMELLPLGLPAALLRRVLIGQYGVDVGESEVERLRRVLGRDIVPELEDFSTAESFVRLAGVRGESLADAFHRLLPEDAADTADAAARNAVLHGTGQRSHRQLPGGESLGNDAAEVVLTNATRTAAGRLVGPGHDLHVWREGVRLLADEVVKAVGYALVRVGYPIAAMHDDEIVLAVGDGLSGNAAEQIAEVARDVQRVLLGRFAATCACRQVEAW